MSTTTRSAVSDSVGDARTVPVGGGRTVAYAEYGDPEGRPVLFLHGTPGSRLLGALFEGVARDEGVRVLAPDRPGCGVSEPHPGRTLSDTGEFLAPVLRDAGVSRAGVVGFSGGGPHALAFAATHADLVAGVDVVAGAVPPALRESTPRTQRILGTLARRTPTLLSGLLRAQGWVAGRGSPDAVVSQYTTGDRPAELTEEDAELVRKDFLEAVTNHRSGTVTESALLDREWDFDPAGVDVPVRLHHGERDANVPVAGAHRLADELGAETTVFEDADHLGTLLRSRAGALAPY
jgi:pimeloyl-ACP methyl ester carboxylesterase